MDPKQWDRVANNYNEEILSPILDSINNPLLKDLDEIKDKKEKTVAEFGCGKFLLAEKLSKFRKVHASDFSEEMVRIARNRNKYPNIGIKNEDITKIRHKNKFDIALSINSVIMPDLEDIKKSFSNIYNSLKKEGVLFLIVPSMESVLKHGFLLLNEETKKGKKNAVKKAKQRFEKEKYERVGRFLPTLQLGLDNQIVCS